MNDIIMSAPITMTSPSGKTAYLCNNAFHRNKTDKHAFFTIPTRGTPIILVVDPENLTDELMSDTLKNVFEVLEEKNLL